jgi:hypothetical protein
MAFEFCWDGQAATFHVIPLFEEEPEVVVVVVVVG